VGVPARFSAAYFALISIGFVLLVGSAAAAASLTEISTDPYTNTSSQHATQVEPDTLSNGSTIVSVFQSGRFFDGGSSNVGWATSTDGGATWTHGFLPGTTTYVGGPYDRVSDPSVAYDARHGEWVISTIALMQTQSVAVLASRSTDGINWTNPVVVANGNFPDKNWTVCDSTASSPHYGNCYTEWDDNGSGNLIRMSTSTDGGATWGPGLTTANSASGIGGQPVVTKRGVVIVPIDDCCESSVQYFKSKNGGSSWTATKLVATISDHSEGGNLRSGPLPSAEIDGGNKVYIVWQDCRFRAGCSSNDIVMATIKGTTVTAPVRIPIDATTSTVDHFIPGLAVDRATSGSNARLGLTYYYYPVSSCNASTCQLDVGFVSSGDGGATWSSPTTLAGPMTLSWLASTNQGRMVGDYISGSFAGGKTHPVFAVAKAPNGSVFDEAMYTPSSGLLAAGVVPTANDPVLTTKSDHPALPASVTAH